ncbi:MAG TPA: efflux RND transporter periplasmic adaptor subunit [Acidobacteriota bacterium]|nr:efflux RND transporter periplasmic adaptor subunit [Acidobacteriota bacterium]
MKTIARMILRAALPALVLILAAGCRAKGAAEAKPSADTAAPGAPAPVSVTLTPEAVAAADIKTEIATMRVVARRVTAAGELEWNGRRLVNLTARTPGRLERVLAVRGDHVREGQLLAEIYSPDFLAMQAEYIQAAARAKRHAGDAMEESNARAVLAGARDRLTLLGVSAAEIESLDAKAMPMPLLAVRAPLAGTILESTVVPGDAVELGTSLFRLVDPSTLWACLHIVEEDLGAAKAGSEVVLKAHAYPGEEFHGRLILVGDVVDAATRTVEGRVEVSSAGGRLKAGMYVEGTTSAGGERRALVVPEESVQDDEGRPIVFVKTGERVFVRRAVETGERFPGSVEIVKGLAEGETVVTSGSFLLKSEMRKGALVGD